MTSISAIKTAVKIIDLAALKLDYHIVPVNHFEYLRKHTHSRKYSYIKYIQNRNRRAKIFVTKIDEWYF